MAPQVGFEPRLTSAGTPASTAPAGRARRWFTCWGDALRSYHLAAARWALPRIHSHDASAENTLFHPIIPAIKIYAFDFRDHQAETGSTAVFAVSDVGSVSEPSTAGSENPIATRGVPSR